MFSHYKVAIDGLAASGKSTVAKALAVKLELDHLDTGAMYRAVAYSVLEAGIDVGSETEVAKLTKRLDIKIKDDKVLANDKDISQQIRSAETTQIVSQVAAYRKVRKQLRKKQLSWVAKQGGGVLEGRDIGTVILPKADIKIFVVASDEVRAQRRAEESGFAYKEVLKSLKQRDEFDKGREHAPLRKAQDAIVVDTTEKSVDEVVAEVYALLEDRYEARLKVLTEGMDPTTSQKSIMKVLAGIVRFSVFVVFRIYCRGKVYNRNNIPKKEAVIWAVAAHRSNLDAPFVGSISFRLLRYMAKDSLFVKSRFYSRVMLFLGGFPIRRNRLDRKSLNTAVQFLSKNQSIVLCPEGERKVGPKVFPLFKGVVWLSQKMGVPILPIGLAGGEDALPIGKKIIRPKKVVIYVGELIAPPIQRVNRKELDQLTEELRDTLQELYDKAISLR